MNFAQTIMRILPRASLALFLAVALTLPNYARAFEPMHVQDDTLTALYDHCLSEIGAQEAHALLPALAIPASLAAAGVTAEMFAAASAAIFTAVAGVSLLAAWDDLSPTQKSEYGTQGNYITAANLAALSLSGYLQNAEPGGEPPEFKGPDGEKLKNIFLRLCGVGAGTVALAELGFMAKDLIDFIFSPAGSDANGFPTGLLAESLRSNKVSFNGVGFTYKLISGPITGSLEGITGFNTDYLCHVQLDGSWYAFTTIYSNFTSSTSLWSLNPSSSFRWNGTKWVASTSSESSSLRSALTNLSSLVLYAPWNALLFDVDGKHSARVSSDGTIQYYDDKLLFSDSWSPLYPSTNAPGSTSSLVQDVANAGFGTPAADQVVNNYVTNNLAASDKVVTAPTDLTQTGDYNKVVTDPKPGPDPDPGPDPGKPGQDPTVTVKDFLKLPFEQLFPFCLVYDIRLLIEHVAGSPATRSNSLVFTFNLGFGYFDAPFVIDLTEYRDMQQTFHLAFNVMMIVGLLYFSISLFLKARSD